MTKEFKYIEDKDQYLDFLVGFQDISTNDILADHKISKLYRRELTKQEEPPTEDALLKMAESFLFLHQDREDYELCQVIIDHYPELRKSAENAFDSMFEGTTPKDINF